MPLREYLRHLREAIDRFDDYGFAETIDIREEVRAGKQAIIKWRLYMLMDLL